MSGKEEMTSLERVAAALNYQKPDRVPTVPLILSASARVLGVSHDKWSMDAELSTESMLQTHELIGFDAFVAAVDLSVEAYDFGQKVIFPKDSTAYTDTNNPMIKTVEDYYKIERIDPTITPRMKMNIERIRRWKKAKGDEVAILGFVYGPLGVLSSMRSHDKLFKDCLKHPDALLHAEEVITDVLIDYAKAQIDAGAHAICLDTLYSSESIMSKKLWEKIEGPSAKRFCDEFHKMGVPVTLHNCGNGIYFDVQQKWLNPCGISHAYPADDCSSWEEHVDKWGKQIVTMGYLTPSEIGLNMTADEVMEECRRQFDLFKKCDGGFILAGGCEYPPNGSLLNAAAMVKASKAYCRYV